MSRVFNQKIEFSEGVFQNAGDEIEDAFQIVGIMVRAKINRLCNEKSMKKQ